MPSSPCITCSYDLSSLSEDALCPECATPVRLSMFGDLIEEPPRLLSRLVGAATLLNISIVSGFLELLFWAAMLTPQLRAVLGFSMFVYMIAYVLHGFGAISAAWGFLMLASRAKGPLPIRRERIARSALSVCAILACVGAVTGSVFAVIMVSWSYDPSGRSSFMRDAVGWIISAGWGLAALTGLLAWALALHILRGFALRAPDARAARRSARLIAPTLVSLALVGGAHAASVVGAQLAPLGFVAIMVAQLVLGVLWLRAVLSVRRAFTRVRARRRDLESPVLSAPPLAPDQP